LAIENVSKIVRNLLTLKQRRRKRKKKKEKKFTFLEIVKENSKCSFIGLLFFAITKTLSKR